jgi:hypothetical protein
MFFVPPEEIKENNEQPAENIKGMRFSLRLLCSLPYRHLWVDCLEENMGASTSHNPMGIHGVLRR